MIFETHGHYDDEQFDTDREQLLEEFQRQDIRYVMNIGANIATSKASVELAHQYDFIYAAIGTHPDDAPELSDAAIEMYRQMAADEKVKAIGEIGLDYFHEDVPKEVQIHWFRKQLELAEELKLPVVIHSRDAAKDTMDIMKEMQGRLCGGVIHCFSYSTEIAREYIKMGYYIGVGGVVTFNNGRKLKEVVEAIPLTSIVLETDSPYLSPVPFRGKRNSALNIPYVAKEIAALKKVTEEEVYDVTFRNSLKLYRMEENMQAEA